MHWFDELIYWGVMLYLGIAAYGGSETAAITGIIFCTAVTLINHLNEHDYGEMR